MTLKFTYRGINIFFGAVVAINLANLALSRAHWPTAPGFPSLIDGRPALSLLIGVALVVVCAVIQISIRDRPKEFVARMSSYALTVGAALVVMFEALDMVWGALLRVEGRVAIRNADRTFAV